MTTQVHLNPTELSILSISRDKTWLFSSAILRLLHRESLKSNQLSDIQDASSEEDDDEDYNEDQEESGEMISSISSLNTLQRYLPDYEDRTHKIDRHVDNSSKLRSSEEASSESGGETDAVRRSIDKSEEHEAEEENMFFHIAYSPIECTVICSKVMLARLFSEPLRICNQLNYDDVKLIDETFLNLQVDSDGTIDNSSKILELTEPLSKNNISLFFLSSHFCDNVLIPYNFKEIVIEILSKNGFEFSDISNSYISSSKPHSIIEHSDNTSSEIEKNAFKAFENAGIKPMINTKSKMLLTGARTGETLYAITKTAEIIAADLLPEYFSITRTSASEVSLILPSSSKKRSIMGFSSRRIIGSTKDVIIPITIDLYKLPLDLTGIVAGVASRITNGIKFTNYKDNYSFEMIYLSMARSAIIMIPKDNLVAVSHILSGESPS
ncbi:Piso0_004238 [Millerozyma farinosa CBS 7064]|uniref:Piso0_004238 protein n=1 Tax=Pichia sorbitophila (strain ATCC MYA-4447 / BCRC 22081 / CBS 7064 / NBRC 10061 / NRRL Y-12695) TaxID=559304 RepID=G8Y7V4_PICSO|nr:Piso0_004238 [Millerozyma farinosa CBS 7064]CCE84684.1 Piso0_004238 [Millerozyma farinosa CBS 7064]